MALCSGDPVSHNQAAGVIHSFMQVLLCLTLTDLADVSQKHLQLMQSLHAKVSGYRVYM